MTWASLRCGRQHLGLGGLARLARLDLEDLDRAKTERSAAGRGALDIVLRQQRLGGAAEPTDGEEGDLHAACPIRDPRS
jgi:hypothetical protein